MTRSSEAVRWGRFANLARVFAALTGLVGALSLLRCNFEHYCLCGHLVHRYSPAEVALDWVWLTCFGLAPAFTLVSNMEARRVFYVMAVLSVGVSQLTGGFLGGPLVFAFAVLCGLVLFQEGLFAERPSASLEERRRAAGEDPADGPLSGL